MDEHALMLHVHTTYQALSQVVSGRLAKRCLIGSHIWSIDQLDLYQLGCSNCDPLCQNLHVTSPGLQVQDKLALYLGLVVRIPVCFMQSTKGHISLRILICTFVILSLVGIVANLATCTISNYQIVSVAKKAGLSLNWLKTPNTDFLLSRPI